MYSILEYIADGGYDTPLNPARIICKKYSSRSLMLNLNYHLSYQKNVFIILINEYDGFVQ
jgi:hypothetical protein